MRASFAPRSAFASSRALTALALLVVGCATVGSEGEGDVGLPTAGVGPFRKLAAGEVNGVAPFVLDDQKSELRDPAALVLDTGGVALYMTASVPDASGVRRGAIVRTRADDGRSFFGAPLDSGHAPRLVLAADQPWEAENVGGASAVRVDGQIFLFYAALGGIGLATSDNGLDFHKLPGPILDANAGGTWELTAPHSPSVARLPDGRYRMLYTAGRCIGEAEGSSDARTWKRLDADPSTPEPDPIFCPSAPVDSSALAPGEQPPFDTTQVDDPLLLPRITPSGRLHIRVLYTGYGEIPDDGGPRPSAIGFAGRFGDSGPLERASSPVFSVGKHERGPALFDRGDGTALLYVGQDHDASSGLGGGGGVYSAIGAAFAPANQKLDTPVTFATSP